MLRLLLIPIIAVLIGLVIYYDPGYVLIHYHHWAIETPVWFALVMVIFATILFHLLVKIFHIPKNIYDWYQTQIDLRYRKDVNALLDNIKNDTDHLIITNTTSLAILKKYQLINQTSFKLLEKKLYQNQLKQAELKNINCVFNRIPKKIRRDIEIVECYLQQLMLLQQNKTAVYFLEKYLKHNGINHLVRYYGEIIYDAKRQLKLAEKWLHKNQKNPDLLYTLGLLSYELKVWGKARQYLEQSIAIKPSFHTYRALINLLEYLQQPQLTYPFYQAALQQINHSS